MQLAFILGREPHLSIAELFAVLGDDADWGNAQLSGEALVLDLHHRGASPEAAAAVLMDRLAGVQKIATVLGHITRDAVRADTIAQHISASAHPDQRVRYGFSVYTLGGDARAVEHVRKNIRQSTTDVKQRLESAGRKVRHVTSRDATLSTVTVAEQKLLPEKNGVELAFLVTDDGIVLTRTLAVQPFKAWSTRDYGRPRRDARSGMLPPKLARMMVNIALGTTRPDAEGGATLLDPFCGSGTILMEAMLLGIPRIIGTDVSAGAVADTQENVEWVRRAARAIAQYPTQTVSVTPCDIHGLVHCMTEPITTIATEPTLGPPQPRAASTRLPAELSTLYLDAFRQFAKVLKPGARVAFVFPQATHLHGLNPQPFCAAVTALGFTQENPFPPALRNHPVLKGKEHLPYARTNQRVGRRILLFTRQRTDKQQTERR
ncbi:MAG: hypothetical protein Q7S96_03740 [bacterium]|nr:hypothetical protein [bacterium]